MMKNRKKHTIINDSEMKSMFGGTNLEEIYHPGL